MKTCTSRSIDIQYWQNTPNRNILYQCNKTVSLNGKSMFVQTSVVKVLVSYYQQPFWLAQSFRNSTSYSYGFSSRYVGYMLQDLCLLSISVIPQ